MISSPYSFSSVSVIFLIALLFAATSTCEVDAAEPPVDPSFPICKTVINAGNQSFDMNFCMEALDMNYRKFAIITVDLLTANATRTAGKIFHLLKNFGHANTTSKAAMKWCLQSCRAMYGSILSMQPRCRDLVRDFRYDEAKSCLGQAARETELCEAEFARHEVVSALAVENDCAFKLARLASALLDHA